MKKWFYIGFLGLFLFEIAQVYFIMPLPGSQEMNSITLAYFLYQWRWLGRLLFLGLLVLGLFKSVWKKKWVLGIAMFGLTFVIYLINAHMQADIMFKQPKEIIFLDVASNRVEKERLVIGLVEQGIARAYPIQILAYHHFIYDTIAGKPFLITYCSVCRTARVFDPTLSNKVEQFRLVGMNHFNAMIEDATTKSWWRQSTGEAIIGPLKGLKLKEIHCQQSSLSEWLSLYPSSTILQPDKAFQDLYDTSYNYENGSSKNSLTGTNSLSWQKKSWVIGVKIQDEQMAIDWNELVLKRVIQRTLGQTTFFIVLSDDNKGFYAYENPTTANPRVSTDTLYLMHKKFRLNGVGIDTIFNLTPVNAYQEFWHSWITFQPETKK